MLIVRGHGSEQKSPRVYSRMENPVIWSVSEHNYEKQGQDDVGACATETWPHLECHVQLGISINKQYVTNRTSYMRLNFQCWWQCLSGSLFSPSPPLEQAAQVQAPKAYCRLAMAWVAVAPLRIGPTWTAPGSPASCQPSSSSLTATGGFLSRGKIPPFPPPPL